MIYCLYTLVYIRKGVDDFILHFVYEVKKGSMIGDTHSQLSKGICWQKLESGSHIRDVFTIDLKLIKN